MKRYVYVLSSFCTGTKNRMQAIAFTLCILFSALGATGQQYTPISCTGFNNDIIANGVGSSSILGTSNPTIGVDGARYTFIDNTFKYAAANALPTCFMPVSNMAASAQTSGLTYVLQGYGTSAVNNNNVLTIDNNSTTYLTSPFPNSATLTLTPAASFFNLRVLYESVVNVSPLTVDVTVTFTDATTQTFLNNACANWFTATLPAYSGMGRTSPTGGIECGSSPNFFPNLFELQLALLPANQTKLVQSITITIPTTLTTGTTPDKVNYFHALAVGGLAPMCPAPSFQATNLVQGATTLTSIAASFTNASTLPSGYLVVRYPAGASPTNPVDGTTYTSGNTLGTGLNAGTVIQANNTTSFIASGLFGGTSYDFYVYSYATGNCGGPVYLTTAPLKNTVVFATSPCGTMTGNIPVGPTVSPIYPAPGGGFLTLTSALAYITANGLGGATALELQSNYTSGSETFPITFPSNPCIGSVNSLTIRPAANATGRVITSGNATATIDFNGAQYVTIDGRPGGTGAAKQLSIINTLTTAISTIRFNNEASNNTVLFCDIQGASTTSANPTTSGVIFFGSTTGTNGNDNNTISTCDIHSVGATLPAIGIGAYNNKANGTASDNDNNTITGCNIYDFFIATAASTGIKIDAGNNNYSITNNRMYQTATRAYTGAFTFRFLWLNPNSTAANITFGSGHTVTGNTFGGTTNTNSGIMTISGTSTSTFIGMDISVGNGTGTVIQSNTLAGIAFSSINIATTGTGIFSGISVNYGNVTNISSNTIGTVTGPVTVTSNSTTASIALSMGIRIGGGTLPQTISGNTVGYITALRGTATLSHSLFGIYINGGSTTPVISNNTIVNLITGNNSTTSTTAQQTVGISISSATVTNPVITGNTISDLSNFAASSNTGATGVSVFGILLNNSSLNTIITVSKNTLYNLSNTAVISSLSYSPYIQGIFFTIGASCTVIVDGNFIHSFSVPNWTVPGTSTSTSTLAGINTQSASNYTITNNMIRLGISGTGGSLTQPFNIMGIYRQVTSGTFNIWHNSIYIGGTGVTATSAAVSSSGIYRSNGGTDNIANNILVSTRSNVIAGGMPHYAVRISGTSGLTINNNVYYYTGGPGNFFAYDGVADVPVYNASTPWVSADVNSLIGDPRFVDATGNASAVNLHINASLVTPVESTGTNIPSVTLDFDGQTRASFTAVDIGADAGNFTGYSPCVAPVASPSLTLSPVSVSQINGSFTNTGTDGYLVVQYLDPASPVNPVNGLNYSIGASLGTGTVIASISGAGPFAFNATGLTVATSYTYYVYGFNTTACTGGPIYSAAVPQSASTNPCSGLGTLVPIGPGLLNTPASGFTSLTNALNYLKTNGTTGAVTLELQTGYTSAHAAANETYPIAFTALPCYTASTPLTVRPAAGVSTPIVLTSANIDATVLFNDASYVTIDGRPGGTGTNKFMVIENTSSTAGSAGNAVLLRNESSNNLITYTEIRSANANPAANTVITASGSIPGAVAIGSTSGAAGNDNNILSFCSIHSLTSGGSLGVCVYSGNGTTAGTAANNDFNTIANCNLYDFFLGAAASAGVNIAPGNNNWSITDNSLYATGALTYTGTQVVRAMWITPNTGSLTSASGFVITGNYIGGSAAVCSGLPMTFTGTTNYQFYGMDISVGTGTVTSIQNNTLTNWNLAGGFSGNVIFGINIANGNAEVGTVTGNLVGSGTTNGAITITTSVTNGSMIALRSGAGSTINFSNNIISGINVIGNATTLATGFNGIAASGGATIIINNNIIGSATLANSINMVSASATSTTAAAVRGIICNSVTTGTVSTVTNNLIANINTNYSATGTQASTLIGITVTTGTTTVSNNTIRNLSSATRTTNGGTTAGIVGISLTSTTAPVVISRNTIHSLQISNPTATTAVACQAIAYTGPSSGANVIERNFIHSLSVANPSNAAAILSGMDVGSGLVTIQNNMIRLGLDENGTSVASPCMIRGISSNSGTANIYFNSVYLGGSGVGTSTANSFCYQRTGGVVSDVRNNIFQNERSNNTTGGKHYALNLSGNTSITLNNNIYTGSGTGYVFGFNGTVDVPTYSTGWISGDINSFTDNPMFLNPTGTSATVDLHINPVVATRVEQFGGELLSVTEDFDGEVREDFTPTDIGADAGDYTALFYCNGSPVAASAELTDTTKICGSGSRLLILTGINTSPGFSYQWKESTSGLPGTFQKIQTAGTSATYTTPLLTQTKYYYCEVTCNISQITTPSTTVAVVIYQAPVLTITPPTGTNVCSGATVLMTATGAATYSWTGSNAAGIPRADFFTSDPLLDRVTSVPVSSIGTATPSTILTPQWTYNLTGTSDAGCTASASVVLNVIAATVPQTLTYSQSPDPTCSIGAPVTLTVTNNGSPGTGTWTYNWYDQAGTTLLQTTTNTQSSNAYTPPVPSANGLYSYVATVTNSLCPYSYASADASFQVGFTSRKTATNANCGNNGMITVFPEGQNNFSTWYSNNFAVGVQNSPTLDQIYGNTSFTSGRCQLNASAASQTGGTFMVRNPAGINTNNLQVDYKLTTSPRAHSSAWGADGIAWSYGPNVYQGVPSSANSGFLPENGTGTGLKLAMDAVNNGAINIPGVYLMYNCPVPHQGPASDGVLAFKKGTFWKGLVDAPVSIVITDDGYVTVSVNNDVIFDHVKLPDAYLTANKSTWNHAFTARTGAGYELHAIDDLNIRYNSSIAPGLEYSRNSTNGSDGTWQPSNVFTQLAAGNYPVWVRNATNPSCVSNTGMVTIASENAPAVANTVTVSGDNSILCQFSTIALTTDVFVPGATYLWESASSASGPWTPAAGTNNTQVYTTAPLQEDTWFRCNYTCPSASMVTANPIFVDVNVGTVANTNGPYYLPCAGKTITMNVTPSAFTTLVWYGAASGGSPLATGNTYTVTPATLPATYYIEPTTTLYSNQYFHGGQLVISNAFGTASLSSTDKPVRFTTTANVIIDSIKVYPTAVGTLTVVLQPNQSTTVLQTYSMPIISSQLNTAVNVPVNFQIIGGGNYQLNTSGVACTYYNGYTGPYSSAGVSFMIMGGGILNITGSATSATLASAAGTYGTSFDFNISSACASGVGARVPVVVGLDPLSKVSVTPLTPTVCQGGVQELSASSVTAYNSYSWSPISNLYIDAAATVPYTANSNASTVYLRSVTAGLTPYYVATATGSAEGCNNKDSTNATITVAPAVNVSASLSSICSGGSTMLTAASSNPGYTYTWSPGALTSSVVSVSPSVHTNYTVSAEDKTNGINKGCVSIATYGIGVNKVGVFATANPTGICSGDNSQLFSSASTTAFYSMANTTASVVPVPGGGVTVLSKTVPLTSGNYDNGYWNVNLPFQFSFFGDLFNVVSVSTNGYITFGAGSTASSVGTVPNLSGPNNAIYLAGGNCNMSSTGSIRMFTIGAAPNRRFILDFLNVPTTGLSLNGQIVLSESEGRIDLTLLTATGETMGIENASGTTAYAPSLRNGSFVVNSPEALEFVPIGGSLTYAWSPSGNLDDATLSNPVASGIFSTTTFSVSVTDGISGCSNTAATTITTGAPLAVTVAAEKTAICLGESTTLNAIPTGGCSPYAYQWEDANGIISNFSFVNVSPTVNTTYYLTLTDNAPVPNEFTYSITINVNPVPAVTATQGLICGTGSATLNASGAGSYEWSPAFGLSATTGASVTSTVTETTVYTVTGTTPAGCSASATSQVMVSNSVAVNVTAAPTQINSGHNSQLTAAGQIQGTYYTVAPLLYSERNTSTLANAGPTGDEGNANANIPFLFKFFGNNYSAFTIHTNGQILMGAGRTDYGSFYPSTAHTNIPNVAAPNNWVGFWADMNIVSGQVTWDVVGTAPNRKFIARWNNASWFSSGPSPLSYQIELNESTNIIDVFLTSVNGGSTSPSHTRLVALENAAGTVGTAPPGRTPANGFWNATNEAWRFVPINNFIPVNPTISYSWTPATYLTATDITNPVAQNMSSSTTYTVTATSSDGCTASATTTVNVGLPFVATASATANNFCQGGSTTLSATATGGGIPYASYSWSNGVSVVGTGASISQTPPAGTTTYTVTVTDVDNFTTTASVTVTVKPNPTVILTKSGDICGSGSVTLNATGTSASYTWTASPSLTVNAPGDNATATPGSTTTYAVTGSLDGCNTTTSVPVNVFPAVTINASALPGSICQNGTSQLSASPTAGYSFSWSPATFLSSSTVSNPVVTNATASTAYTVTATQLSTGCTGTATVSLTVGSPLVVSASASVPAICAGASVSLSTTATGGGLPYSYSWSNGTSVVGTTANISVSPAATTSYHVTVTDACGAVVQSSDVTVIVNPLPALTVSPATSSICVGVATSALLTASGADTYAWTPADGLSATSGAVVTASPEINTVYTVTGTITSTGCTKTALASVNLADLLAEATAYPASVCMGSNSQLVAYAANGAQNYTLNAIASLPIAPVNATTITAWANTDMDDGSAGPIALPFKFNFYGVNYNQVYIGTNGYVSFSSLASISGINSRKAANLTNATAANNVIALCYADLNANPAIGSTVKYFVAGTAPNRVFVIDINEKFLTSTGNVTGQIQLFENSNVVEVHITSINHGTSTSPAATGIENADGTLRVIPAVRMPGTWNVTSAEAWRFSPPSGFNFSWSPATFLSSTNVANPVISGFNASTVYTVTATEISSGCQVSDVVTVDPLPLPTAVITGSAEICVGASTPLNFTFTGTAPFVYSYSNGSQTFGPFTSAGNTATQTVSPAVATNYTLVSVADNFCDGTISGNAMITLDSEAPVISCPASVTVNTNAGVDFATGVVLGTATATDNCSVSSVTNNGPSTYLVGNTTVTWTATDSNGNTATCSQVVTVIDNQAPVITCPASLTVSSDPNQCYASQVDLGILDAIDNNGVANITNNELSQYPIGVTTVTWIATDLSGNTSTCSQTVTVQDNQFPVISCPASKTVNPDPGVCYATGVNLGNAVASDNCAFSVTNNAPVQFQAGATTVTWTVTDASGNAVTCTQVITVVDNEKPVLVNCPANFSSCAPISWTPPTAADNCTPANVITITSNYAPGAYFPSGVTTVIYTATDANGNTATCSFQVTKQDSSSMAGLSLTSNKAFNNICVGDNITISINGITAANKGYNAQWKWYSGSCGGTSVPGSTNQASITVNPVANTTYFVRLEGPCNTTSCISLPVVVTSAPPSGNPTVIYYPAIAYQGASDSIVVNAVPGATFYHWTTSGNSNILFNGQPAPYESSSPKVMLTFISPATSGNGIGNYHIQFFAGNACGTTNSNNIRIRATVDQPSSVSGPLVACVGGGAKTYTVTPVVGAKSYQWTLTPAGAGTITGNGTQTVSITYTSLPATLCVHAVSAFGTAGPDLCMNISTVTATPGAVTGNTTPCLGSTETYSIPAVDGAVSYNWTTNIPGATITGNGTSATVHYPVGVFNGDVCVTANSGCSNSAPSCLAIVSGTVPPIGGITGITDGLCGATSVNYQVPSTGATAYTWTVPAGDSITFGQGTNSILVNFTNSTVAGGYITVMANNSCGTVKDSIAITEAPSKPVFTDSATSICENMATYTVSSVGATHFVWDVTGAEAVFPGSSENSVNIAWGATGGTVSVVASNNCGSISSDVLIITCPLRLASAQTMMVALHALVYPNPSQGKLTLQYNSPDATECLLKVRDLTGRVLLHESLAASEGTNLHEINLGGVAKGVYMLSLENAKGENVIIRLVID